MKLKSSVRKANGIGITVAALTAAAATTLLTGARLAPNAAGEQQAHMQETTRTAPVAFTRPDMRRNFSAEREYTVRSGDTLAVISGREYGSVYCWPGIYDANRGSVANPDLIYPGQALAIPGACGRQSIRPQPVTVAAVSRPAVQTPAPVQPSGSYGVSSSFQACVIRTESGGNPDVWNASGHWGLYQFSESTWIAYGGAAGDFGSASAAEQTQVFDNAMATPGGASNWAPYDGC